MKKYISFSKRNDNQMSELHRQNANNIIAEAISQMLKDPKNKGLIENLAKISQLFSRIDSQVPGAADALLNSIITNYRQKFN